MNLQTYRLIIIAAMLLLAARLGHCSIVFVAAPTITGPVALRSIAGAQEAQGGIPPQGQGGSHLPCPPGANGGAAR